MRQIGSRTSRSGVVGTGILWVALTSVFVASPLSGQGYGRAVAAGDNEVFVGESRNEMSSGVVYIYREDASGSWTEATELRAADASNGDRFGRSLVSTGETLFVGATGTDDGAGAVYIFRSDASGAWRQENRIRPGDLSSGDAFGLAEASDGATILVSSEGRADGRGAVYVFRLDASGTWEPEGKLVGSDTAAEDLFGAAVAVQGNLAVVGAAGHDHRAGTAYIFRRDASGTWKEAGKLTSQDLQRGYRFGASVAVEDARVLVGAPGFSRNVGAVYVFQRDEDSGRWEETEKLLPFDGPRFAQFGTSIALDDKEAWIGAPRAAGLQGRIYRVDRDGSSREWMAESTLAAADMGRGDRFGSAVAVHGGLGVVGLTGDDYGAGTAVIFRREGHGWREASKVWSRIRGMDPVAGREIKCTEGSAALFDCNQVDLLSFLPVQNLGGGRGVRVNDVWGWTDPDTGREYAIIGRVDGTSFVDISDPFNPVYLGNLPKTPGSPGSTWRDMKVYHNYVFVVADGAGAHGMQVFDLKRLRTVKSPPVEFDEDAHYDRIHSAHNIVIDTTAGFAFTVGNRAGGETCGGGLHMIDIREPTRPVFAGCFADTATGRQRTGYTHDAECLIYQGPDEEHRGREICFGANETALSIADVTDKQNPKPLAVAQYPNVGYAHQGWLTDDQRYFFMDDELDELQGHADRTRTLVWDVADLDDPVLVKEFFGATAATDHNLYIKGHYVYQSNYVAGLRVLDISDPENPKEVAYFDTVPYGENAAGFGGSWSNYPFFPSGAVIVTSSREGLFVLKKREPELVP